MPWFKVDDQIPMSPKFMTLPLDAIGLWVICGAWSASQLTDGMVPEKVVRAMCVTHASDTLSRTSSDTLSDTLSGAAKQDAKRTLGDPAQQLVDAGLWERVDGGYKYHDWGEYQPTRAAVEATRARMSELGRKGGKARSTRGNKRESSDTLSDTLSGAAKQDAKRVANGAAKPRPVPDPYITPSLRSGVQGGDDSDEPHLPDVVADAPTAPEAVASRAAAKGTRLPDGWGPSRTPANLAVEDGHSPEWLTGQLDRFRDYWAGVAGQRGRKRDWDATWRNWLRRSAETPSRPQGRPATGLTDDEWQDAYSRAAARDAASVDDASRSNARQSLPMLPRSA